MTGLAFALVFEYNILIGFGLLSDRLRIDFVSFFGPTVTVSLIPRLPDL